jgi:hypothetical protein
LQLNVPLVTHNASDYGAVPNLKGRKLKLEPVGYSRPVAGLRAPC